MTPAERAPATDPHPIVPDYASVLVPLDGSDLAARALATARWLADRLGAGVHLLSAATAPGSRDDGHGGILEEQRARVPGATLHLSDATDAGAAIVSLARELDPCLVCMSTHGRSRTAALVGSTTVRVATQLAAPLVAVGARVRPASLSAERVVVTLDGWPAVERWAERLRALRPWAKRTFSTYEERRDFFQREVIPGRRCAGLLAAAAAGPLLAAPLSVS